MPYNAIAEAAFVFIDKSISKSLLGKMRPISLEATPLVASAVLWAFKLSGTAKKFYAVQAGAKETILQKLEKRLRKTDFIHVEARLRKYLKSIENLPGDADGDAAISAAAAAIGIEFQNTAVGETDLGIEKAMELFIQTAMITSEFIEGAIRRLTGGIGTKL